MRKDTKTLICIGTGGVGKTTIAAALAVGKAREGLKVLVLTIDPSQRLAQTLRISTDGDVHKVDNNLFAATINHTKSFSHFIKKAAQKDHVKPQEIDTILNNKLYQQLSTQLSGSQDFTSLFTLNEFVKSGEYDLVILDTPPAQHTWGFLHAPEKIAQLFNEGIAQWFRDPADKNTGLLKKILNMGTSQVLKALETLTGSEFIKELGQFFSAVQKWQAPLEKQVWDCHKLLTSSSTEFILVTALDPSRINEAIKLSQAINQQGYNLRSIIINRIPEWITHIKGVQSPFIKDYGSYLNKLITQVTDIKAQVGNNLQVYKSAEISQNQNHIDVLQEIYTNIHTF
ncbi:MAG: ArsA family ATPase [Pseudobdellovibrio sp.]